ncbi:tastin isoform X2 [Orcinus orca]|uniref:tastin isoform X2 n=1 Tax=Orcinus orca TaxID=9733 RepID=UPI0021137221|nr:tastin isoform X2 [Orcinus orca]XP_049550864.1 tastin isoform X2 [Orcinus orca]
MTTLQATKDPLLRGVSPTPSKIPVRSQRRPPLPTVKPSALDQENQDPRRLVQKLSSQRPLVDSAGPRPKATHQTEQSERLVGSTQLRNPLEELRPSPGRQNVGPRPPPQTEAPGTIEFVADPAALATILSGEGVKSCRLGRQPSLAQRVLVRGNQGGTIRRRQDARASAYLAPRTPTHRLDPARASCFSRLEGPGPRGRTLCPQRLEALIPPSGPSSHPSAPPGFQELRRETGGNSKTSVSQASGLLLETLVKPASSLPEGEYEVVTHSDERGGGPLGLAQRVPLKETREITHTKDGRDSCLMPSPGQVIPPAITRPSPFGRAQRVPSPGPSAPTSYSVLRRLAIRPKTQFTPLPSAPRAQQAQWLSGLSPQPCPEEPALPWEQIAVRLFDQESGIRLQEAPGKPPVSTPYGPHPSRTPNLQELKLQRISILQQLLRQEVEGLADGKCAPLHGGFSLDVVELQPLLAEISRTLNAPENKSGAFHLPGMLQHSGLPKPYLPEGCGEPEPCPGAEPEVALPCPPAEPGPPESYHRRGPEISEPSTQEASEPCPLGEPGPLQACPQGQTGLPEPSPRVEPGVSEACSLEPRSPESSPWSCCSQWAPATTSLTFSSQRPLCASPPIHSLQSLKPPTGQAGKELVGRGCEQRRSSSLAGSRACPAPGDPTLSFPYLPCPSLALPQEEVGGCTFSPVLLIGLALGRGVGKGSIWWESRTPESALISLWPLALRPQQSGPSNPGPEAAPQSMSDRHPPLPRGPPGRRVCLLHQPSPSLRPHPGLHQPCGHIARTAGCPGEPPVHSQLCLWEVGSRAGGHPRLLYRGQGEELVTVQGRLGCDEARGKSWLQFKDSWDVTRSGGRAGYSSRTAGL